MNTDNTKMHASAKRADVAKAAGVSESTVSRALNNSSLITEGVRERVKAAARRLGYIPNVQARNFARQKTFRLGFVVRSYKSFPPFSRAYFPTLLDGVLIGAEKFGYSVTIILDKQDGEYKDLAEIVRSKQVDGIIFSVIPVGDTRTRQLIHGNVPFVLVNDYEEGCSSVDARPMQGMEKAIGYLTDLGHTKIGFITGDMHYHNARDRLETFTSLTEKHNISSTIANGDFSRTSGYRCAGKLLCDRKPPTAIMTSSDREAFGVLDYCREHDIGVPERLSIIGFDNLFIAQEISPPLSTVNNPVQKAGEVAAELLIGMITKGTWEPEARWLKTDFIVRQSSGQAKKEEC